ncbi:lpd-9 [Pristionchus pacificus]|uniref:Lpd-9 n=1 Tax=Pristionchus pacificus TaxID=54126 RepID=A0A454XYQ3_PRIPA|nr:lpd-9 [Pristionchus pacificus]|eukprot:PDM84875.1 lpd-9 [Pristionchus pacificus]
MAMSSSAMVIRPALRKMSSRFASTHAHDNLQAFREINKLASEGKWDNINNKPKLFLFGNDKKEAYSAFMKINKSTDFFDQSSWGMYMKVVWRIVAFLTAVKLGVVAYETVVPEQKRLHYKYRHHGDHH